MSKQLISVLIDRTGSMTSIWDATISGINEFITDQLSQDYKTVWDVTVFDSESIDTVRDRVKGKKMGKFKQSEFPPRAMTPLNDALAHVLLRTKKAAKEYDGVIFVIMTDGLENASREYTKADVAKLVKKAEKKGWQFIFMGANMDAFEEASSYGMRGQTITYAASDQSVSRTFAMASAGTAHYATSGKTTFTHTNVDEDGNEDSGS